MDMSHRYLSGMLLISIDKLFTTFCVHIVVHLQLVMTDFGVKDRLKDDSHYTVILEAAVNNRDHDDGLSLTPWY